MPAQIAAPILNERVLAGAFQQSPLNPAVWAQTMGHLAPVLDAAVCSASSATPLRHTVSQDREPLPYATQIFVRPTGEVWLTPSAEPTSAGCSSIYDPREILTFLQSLQVCKCLEVK